MPTSVEQRRCFQRASALLPVLCILSSGCEVRQGQEVLRFNVGQYESAFDAAVESARELGMPPALRDRRSGVIETEPRIAGSLTEPWRGDNSSLGQAAENTLAFQRRRARFEFSTSGFQKQSDIPAEGPESADRLGEHGPGLDFTKVDSELELRVWVFIERAYSPGLRRSTWSRNLTTTTDLVAPERQEGRPVTTYWTPMTRDPAYERRLMEAVRKRTSGKSD